MAEAELRKFPGLSGFTPPHQSRKDERNPCTVPSIELSRKSADSLLSVITFPLMLGNRRSEVPLSSDALANNSMQSIESGDTVLPCNLATSGWNGPSSAPVVYVPPSGISGFARTASGMNHPFQAELCRHVGL